MSASAYETFDCREMHLESAQTIFRRFCVRVLGRSPWEKDAERQGARAGVAEH